jgi:hypothetical protein
LFHEMPLATVVHRDDSGDCCLMGSLWRLLHQDACGECCYMKCVWRTLSVL